MNRFTVSAVILMLAAGMNVARPQMNEQSLRVNYIQFSAETPWPLWKETFASKYSSYDISSLLTEKQTDLMEFATKTGAPCSFHDGWIRLRIQRGGKVLWIDTDGCRASEDFRNLDDTALSAEELDDLKRFLDGAIPWKESYGKAAGSRAQAR